MLANNKFKEFLNNLSKRDLKIDDSLKSLKSQISENNVKIARLEGAISVILNKSQSQKVSISPVRSQENIETKMINRLRRGKKSLILAEISKLKDSNSVIEMFEIIVREKGLCSKASFYRYVTSLKSQIKEIS